MKKSGKEIQESLSENHNSEMERSYTQYENELMDCEYLDKQYRSDMKILTAIIAILLAFILFLIFN